MDGLDKLRLPTPPTGQQKQKRSIYVLPKPVKFSCSLQTELAARLAFERKGYELLAVLDITGSMNTRDYALNEMPISRLEFAKLALRDLLRKLPCSSRLGLGIFTERRPFLLFEPIEVCRDFAPVDAAIAGLDWRMGWEGDSHIAAGLYRAVAMAKDLNADLLFITDGQEAPPLPWSGGPPFEGKRGKVGGLIIGARNYALSPIPKFDDNGREIGFYSAEDVPHESRFGLPPPGAENREGYNPRNAPFDSAMLLGTEHLSSVREPYLKGLANITGLAYRHLARVPDLAAAVMEAATPRPRAGRLDLRPWFIAAAGLTHSSLSHPSVSRAVSFLARAPPASSFHLEKEIALRPSTLAALAFVLATPALAHGPTPLKVDETVAIAADPQKVWAVAGSFGSIAACPPASRA